MNREFPSAVGGRDIGRMLLCVLLLAVLIAGPIVALWPKPKYILCWPVDADNGSYTLECDRPVSSLPSK